MDKTEPAHTPGERALGAALVRWLPAGTATIAAATTILVAVLSSNATQSATHQEYVALAMNILSTEGSSTPSRRWAVAVLSRLSPVTIPKDLASGLITGRSVVPSDLDPTATRREILACLKPILESDLSKPVAPAPLPPESMTVGDITIFGVQQTGQLEKANLRIDALTDSLDICITPPTIAD